VHREILDEYFHLTDREQGSKGALAVVFKVDGKNLGEGWRECELSFGERYCIPPAAGFHKSVIGPRISCPPKV
jgi:hypothetical protein